MHVGTGVSFPQERRAIQTIIEQKIKTLVDTIASVAGTAVTGAAGPRLMREVQALQRLVNASVNALRYGLGLLVADQSQARNIARQWGLGLWMLALAPPLTPIGTAVVQERGGREQSSVQCSTTPTPVCSAAATTVSCHHASHAVGRAGHGSLGECTATCCRLCRGFLNACRTRGHSCNGAFVPVHSLVVVVVHTWGGCSQPGYAGVRSQSWHHRCFALHPRTRCQYGSGDSAAPRILATALRSTCDDHDLNTCSCRLSNKRHDRSHAAVAQGQGILAGVSTRWSVLKCGGWWWLDGGWMRCRLGVVCVAVCARERKAILVCSATTSTQPVTPCNRTLERDSYFHVSATAPPALASLAWASSHVSQAWAFSSLPASTSKSFPAVTTHTQGESMPCTRRNPPTNLVTHLTG